jgi:hypothetical protein
MFRRNVVRLFLSTSWMLHTAIRWFCRRNAHTSRHDRGFIDSRFAQQWFVLDLVRSIVVCVIVRNAGCNMRWQVTLRYLRMGRGAPALPNLLIVCTNPQGKKRAEPTRYGLRDLTVELVDYRCTVWKRESSSLAAHGCNGPLPLQPKHEQPEATIGRHNAVNR